MEVLECIHAWIFYNDMSTVSTSINDSLLPTVFLGSVPPDISPNTFPPEKYANNVVEIEAGMIKQYFSSIGWIDETIRYVNEKLDWWKKSLLCSENVKNKEISDINDLNDHYIWWNTFFVQMEPGLMEIVWSLEVRFLTLISAYDRAIHVGEMSGYRWVGLLYVSMLIYRGVFRFILII